MPVEIWDLYDSARQPLHRTHPRGDKMNPGEYHIAVEIWTADSNRKVLITLRDSRKENYPDKWESTGGSVLAGETGRQAAVRELYEETGIAAREEELLLLGTHREDFAFVDIYLLRRNIPVSCLTMQEGETVAAKWINFTELEAMIADRSFALPVGLHFETVRESMKKELGW